MSYALLIFAARFVGNFIAEYRMVLLLKGNAALSALLAGVEDILSMGVLGAVLASASGGWL